jgi:GTP cyclohydrolase I
MSAEAERVSDRIRERIEAAGASYVANENIANFIAEGELHDLTEEVAGQVHDLLRSLVIDTVRDHNTADTARRVAKMFVNEVFRGRYEEAPRVTDFPNAREFDEVMTVGPITVRSTCSHHFQPITGQAWVGVIPGERVIGLSKFARLVDWIMARPHIQEEAAVMVADTLERLIKPKGLAVVINAEHLCMTMRGVREHGTSMSTSVLRGIMMHSPSSRQEFFDLIRQQGFK